MGSGLPQASSTTRVESNRPTENKVSQPAVTLTCILSMKKISEQLEIIPATVRCCSMYDRHMAAGAVTALADSYAAAAHPRQRRQPGAAGSDHRG